MGGNMDPVLSSSPEPPHNCVEGSGLSAYSPELEGFVSEPDIPVSRFDRITGSLAVKRPCSKCGGPAFHRLGGFYVCTECGDVR